MRGKPMIEERKALVLHVLGEGGSGGKLQLQQNSMGVFIYIFFFHGKICKTLNILV